MSAFLPQKGPLLITADPQFPPERLSRSQAWQIVYWELPHLDGDPRPVNELRMITSDVISMMARNEFPFTVPPRWLSELFEALGRVVELKTEAKNLSMNPPLNLGPESDAFLAAICENIANDKRRYLRQNHSFRAGEDEIISDASGTLLPLPEEDSLIPQLPDGFPFVINRVLSSRFLVLTRPSVSANWIRPCLMMELWIRRANAVPRRRIKGATTWMRRRTRRPLLCPIMGVGMALPRRSGRHCVIAWKRWRKILRGTTRRLWPFAEWNRMPHC